MTKFNRTLSSAAVNGAFNTVIDGETAKDIILRLAVPLQYEFGLFADQDIRVLVSMYYAQIFELVSLMPYDDKPLQDMPKAGSLEANNTGVEDARSVEREEAIQESLKGIAIVHRHLLSLDERARKELEEAGRREADGGRQRFNLKARVYKSIVKSFEDVLIDMKMREPVSNQRRIAQIEQAMEYNLPYVSETDAGQAFVDYLDDERMERSAQRAWDNIIASLQDVSFEIDQYSDVMEKLNAELAEASQLRNAQDRKVACDSVKSRMVLARNEHRQNINYPQWLLKQRLAPTALLAHVGAPKSLIDSPEWRAEEAKLRAAAARAKAQEAQSQIVEMEALMLEQEANMGLMQVRRQMMEMQKAMAKQQAEFKAMMNPPKEAKPAKAKPAKAATPAKETKALAKGSDTLVHKPMKHLTSWAGAAGSVAGPRG